MHSVGKHTTNSTPVALVALVALVSIVGVAWLDVVLGDFIAVHVDTCVTDDVYLHMWYRCLDKEPGLSTCCLDNDHTAALETQPQLHVSGTVQNST